MIASGRYWVIRHPSIDDPKKTVAQFDTAGDTEIPYDITDYSGFKIKEVSGRSSLVDSVDRSGLVDDEKKTSHGSTQLSPNHYAAFIFGNILSIDTTHTHIYDYKARGEVLA